MTLHKAICTVCESRLTQDLPDSINSPADIGAHMNHLGALDHEEMWVLALTKEIASGRKSNCIAGRSTSVQYDQPSYSVKPSFAICQPS